MSEDARWLENIVVLNESQGFDRPGDISVFRSAGEACNYLEPWWVADNEGFALTGSGDRLVLGVFGTRVIVVGREAVPEGVSLLKRWLTSAAAALLAARKHRALGGRAVLSFQEQEDVLPTSIEGLVAYVGFDA